MLMKIFYHEEPQLKLQKMKTIFDQATRDELIARIGQIQANAKPVWGKMDVDQMLRHNTYWNGWILGKGDFVYKQSLMGRIFGRMALKSMIRDDRPLDKNIPTSAQFMAHGKGGDLAREKDKWIELIRGYGDFDNPGFVHDFFGKMGREEIGVLVYKHTDHHLRQFNT
jgi:hypothetical protein